MPRTTGGPNGLPKDSNENATENGIYFKLAIESLLFFCSFAPDSPKRGHCSMQRVESCFTRRIVQRNGMSNALRFPSMIRTLNSDRASYSLVELEETNGTNALFAIA